MKVQNLAALLMLSSLLPFHSIAAPAPAAPAPAVRQPRPAVSPLDAKVNALLKKMTLEEKIGQMCQFHPWKGAEDKFKAQSTEGKIGSFLNVFGAKETNAYQKAAMDSRLHIPLLFGLDVIHGYKTIFPIPVAEDCAWNPDLLEKSAAVAAKEAAAAGVRWTFAPMVDVSREPRWGRIAEGSGEDPTLGSILQPARVRGFQGKNLSDPGSIAACAKHYVGYGAAEAGREYNTTDMSEMTLRSIHLPPFQACVEAGVRTLMSAFNDLNGIPTSGNKHTLRDILKGEWAFKGFVVSDWASVEQLVAHGYASDKKDAAQKGVAAGVDMDMVSNVYGDNIAALIKEKKLSMALIDDAVRRILKVKYELGLFDKPYSDEDKESAATLTPENLATALEEARQSIVLLKNEKNALPLSKDLKTIAVIGSLADSKRDPLGSWDCRGDEAIDKVVTVMDGIKAKVSANAKVLYAPGVGTSDSATDLSLNDAVKTAKQAQVAIVVAGETQDMSGEASSRTSLNLPGRQEEMVKAIEASGVPVVLVLMNGRPLTIPWEAEHIPAIVETWYLGTQHGTAVADVLFGDFNPSGKLVVTFPRSLGQVPIYYSHMNTGRPMVKEGDKWCSKYLDSPNSPQYPFGFGLSYTSYTYSNLALSDKSVKTNGVLKVTAMVKNSGTVKGTEIVQLYIQDIAASITQPVKKLIDFQRITLEPGETKLVEFTLPAKNLGFYNEVGKWVLEPGKFNVWVGRDSSDETSKDSFDLVSGPIMALKK